MSLRQPTSFHNPDFIEYSPNSINIGGIWASKEVVISGKSGNTETIDKGLYSGKEKVRRRRIGCREFGEGISSGYKDMINEIKQNQFPINNPWIIS